MPTNLITIESRNPLTPSTISASIKIMIKFLMVDWIGPDLLHINVAQQLTWTALKQTHPESH